MICVKHGDSICFHNSSMIGHNIIPISLKLIDDVLSSIIQNLNPLQMDLSMPSSIKKTLICSSLCCVVSLLEAWWLKNEIKGIADNITSKTVNVALTKLRPSNMFHGLVFTISIFVIPSSKCSKSVSINSQILLLLQQILAQIWQQHIRRFYSEDLNEDPPSKPPEASPDDNILRNSNGHALALKDNGGMWCRKCGKHVSNLKHIRLKITKSKCLFEHKTPAEYLSQPGLMTSEHRLDLAFEELLTKYSAGGHVLSWNRKLGKKDGPNLGIIKCSQCGREWKWKDRCNNLKRTKCIPSAPSTSHPSAASSSIKHSAPLRRISGKQPDRKISSALTQRTGIGWVQQEGVVGFVLRYSYKPELSGPGSLYHWGSKFYDDFCRCFRI